MKDLFVYTICLSKSGFQLLLETFPIWRTFKEIRGKIISGIISSTCKVVRFLLLCSCVQIIEHESQ
jgi:hypothetical protein